MEKNHITVAQTNKSTKVLGFPASSSEALIPLEVLTQTQLYPDQALPLAVLTQSPRRPHLRHFRPAATSSPPNTVEATSSFLSLFPSKTPPPGSVSFCAEVRGEGWAAASDLGE